MDSYYLSEILQAIPLEEHKILLYFIDGTIREWDANNFLRRFTVITDGKFKDNLTVISGTIGWDIEGTRDENKIIDVDPEILYQESKKIKEEDYAYLFN